MHVYLNAFYLSCVRFFFLVYVVNQIFYSTGNIVAVSHK